MTNPGQLQSSFSVWKQVCATPWHQWHHWDTAVARPHYRAGDSQDHLPNIFKFQMCVGASLLSAQHEWNWPTDPKARRSACAAASTTITSVSVRWLDKTWKSPTFFGFVAKLANQHALDLATGSDSMATVHIKDIGGDQNMTSRWSQRWRIAGMAWFVYHDVNKQEYLHAGCCTYI